MVEKVRERIEIGVQVFHDISLFRDDTNRSGAILPCVWCVHYLSDHTQGWDFKDAA
jgi:hypothetical protein